MPINLLDQIVAAHHKKAALPARASITSICSAHPWVLRAAMAHCSEAGGYLLVESTCNQVNQFGGYTGMRPADFVAYLRQLAEQNHFPHSRLLLGGDHLGPFVWKNEPRAQAMQKALDLVQAYAQAGYGKLHLDASMPLGDDPPGALPVEVVAERAAQMAAVAEAACQEAGFPGPRYVIGTEVPVPGGAQEFESGVAVTSTASVADTIDATRRAFQQLDLHDAWQRVIAVVVQPGVEFGDDFVIPFDPTHAHDLARFIETQPGLIYEAHSTDYQSPQALSALVEAHFAILKVGPALTFALREAVFALAHIEDELFPQEERSHIVAALDDAMLADPQHWRKYYHGDENTLRFARRYSLSDRIRYYWAVPTVEAAFQRLLHNLASHPLPAALLSQYAPLEYQRIREGSLENTPQAVMVSHVRQVLRDYDSDAGGIIQHGLFI